MAQSSFADLVLVTTGTTGTGTITLGSAVTGYLTPAQASMNSGATVCYAIRDGSNSEAGEGVLTNAAGTWTLTRATISQSTNGGSALNLDGNAIIGVGTVTAQALNDIMFRTFTGLTSAYTAVQADVGTVFKMSGTWTLTLPSPSSLGNGWWVRLRNTGTGAVTLAPASGTIDTLSSFVMYAGETRDVQTDGANFFSEIITPFVITLTTTTALTIPPGYSRYTGLLWGGGGGGRSSASANAGGGGGGACVSFDLASLGTVGTTITVTLATAASANSNGSNSTLGSLVTAYGGIAGLGVGTGGAGAGSLGPGTGGTGGPPDGGGQGVDSLYGGGGGGENFDAAGSTLYGGPGGGGATTSSTGTPGTAAITGAIGGTGASTGNAGNGSGPGAGGGGAYNGTGGNGGPGQAVIRGVV